jgi:hypothetical protein
VLDTLLFEIGRADQLNRMCVEPLDQPANGLERIRLMRLDDNTDAPYRRLRHQILYGYGTKGFLELL